MRIGVMASGAGTLFDAVATDGIEAQVLVVDRPCAATTVAEKHGVPSVLLERTKPFDRVAYTQQLVETLEPYNLDLILMLGFLTIVETPLTDRYPNRILNAHPALLPMFIGTGSKVVKDALETGVKITGCTLHIVTPKVDDGPIVAQEAVRVYESDTPETLHERIKEAERNLYPQAIKEFITKCQNEH